MAVLDRRQALKDRHREAILRAAQALIDERHGPTFSVDELADRADVARRTVFNHFGSSSGVVRALAEEVISARVRVLLTAAPRPDGAGTGRAAMFRFISDALRASDLSPAVVTIGRILSDVYDQRTHAIVEEVFALVTAGLREDLLRIEPDADALDVELLVASLMSGISVIARRWLDAPGDRSTRAAVAEWDALLDRCIESIRVGYTA